MINDENDTFETLNNCVICSDLQQKEIKIPTTLKENLVDRYSTLSEGTSSVYPILDKSTH